jgi:ankyrin repeat protein
MPKNRFSLCRAVSSGDLETVKRLIEKGESPNTQDALGLPLLHIAASSGYADVCRFLIEAGAEINEKDRSAAAALHHAARRHNVEIVSILLEAGADVNQAPAGGITPLMAALGAEDLYNERVSPAKSFSKKVDETLAVLIKHGADLNAVGPEGYSALHFALAMFPKNASRLIEAGADVNAANKFLLTPLMSANASTAKQLLEAGADPHSCDRKGRTAMFYCRTLAKARLLKKAGVSPVAADNDGKTPLMEAAGWKKSISLIKWFAEFPENRGAKDKNGSTALLLAAVSGNFEAVKFLAELEDPLVTNNYKRSILIFAVLKRDFEQVKFAVECGCDVNHQDREGNSALHLAAVSLEEEIVDYLLDHGAKAALRNNKGLTALANAIDYCICSIPILARLLEAGADDLDQAIERAKEFDKTEALKFLTDYKANR